LQTVGHPQLLISGIISQKFLRHAQLCGNTEGEVLTEMPAKPAWLLKIPEILTMLEAFDVPGAGPRHDGAPL
jgi:hypothetical protein